MMFDEQQISKEIERLRRSIEELQTRVIYVPPAYGEIYVHDNSSAQSIASGTTYTKSTALDTDGECANCTNDAANNKITITTPGTYFVACTVNAQTGTANINLLGAIFLGGVEQHQIHFRSKFGTASSEFNCAMGGNIKTSASADIDLRFRHDNGSAVNITVTYANLSVLRIGNAL